MNLYKIGTNGNSDDMCPRDYALNVDTPSWGACLCWENGGRRSKNGKSPKCLAALPLKGGNDAQCNDKYTSDSTTGTSATEDDWCLATPTSKNQVCPVSYVENGESGLCVSPDDVVKLDNLPDGLM